MNPAQFNGAGVSTDATGLDGVGEIAQPFRPAKTVDDVDP